MKPPYLLNNEQLTFLPALPAGWKGNLLPGATPYSYTGPAANILIQELKTTQYLLRYFVFRFFSNSIFKSKSENGLQSLLSLKGSSHQRINGLPSFRLDKGQFMLFNDCGSEVLFTFQEGKEYQLWSTCYDPVFYKEWHPIFPELQRSGQQSKKPRLLIPYPFPARTTILDGIREQFYEIYQPKLQEAFNGLKIKDSLFTFLAQTTEEAETKPLTEAQRKSVQQIHELILKDLTVHYSNAELAEIIGVNKTDLKRFFKQEYGLGMFELLQRERFEKARILILEGTLNVKQIAPLVGYPHTTTFITEFRKYFGYTPLDLQSGRRRS